ncbi:CPBP family intramembrane glutamic endopeptidase [Seohaeicola saemankumensis]|uniref:CPBP family intramembrane glutamic endopeptidase n=1 Tax=Seohaeicola saemankumensis TaxID=481181 RepID=A0ABW3THF9_9RHOB
MTASRMTSGLVLKYRNGLRFFIWRGYATVLSVSSWFSLTAPLDSIETLPAPPCLSDIFLVDLDQRRRGRLKRCCGEFRKQLLLEASFMSSTAMRTQTSLPSYALLFFALLTFGITWCVIGGYIYFPEQATATFGEISGGHPLYFLATWAPGIAGFLLVLAFGGVRGLRAFLSRLLYWRCAPVWWAFILIGIPAVFMIGSLIKSGPLLAPILPEGVDAMVALMVMMLFLGPMEEFGWRGVAQPLLQRHIAPFWAGAIIGAAWGFWHLPAFYLAGVVYENWSFLPFFIGNVTLAILVTPIFNASRGSLLLPMLFHWQLINPFWPDAQPYDTWILVVVAVVVVWLTRKTMFSRNGTVTEVILPARDAAPQLAE